MSRICLALWLLLTVFSGPRLRADDLSGGAVLSGESRNARNQLDDARRYLAEQKWPEALDQLQALIDKGADDLVALDPHQTMQARRLAQLLLCNPSLPAEALTLYRNRVEPQARRFLEQGLEQHDER